MVLEVVDLDIVEGIEQLIGELHNMLVGDTLILYQLGERIAVDIIGDYTSPYAGHIFKIVDHYDVGMGEIVAHLKFLLEHLLILGDASELRAQRLEHHPFAELLCGVDMIKLLIPFGEVLDFGPLSGAGSRGRVCLGFA